MRAGRVQPQAQIVLPCTTFPPPFNVNGYDVGAMSAAEAEPGKAIAAATMSAARDAKRYKEA